jgi:hypothetical protein
MGRHSATEVLQRPLSLSQSNFAPSAQQPSRPSRHPLFFFLFLSMVSGSHSSARGLFPFLLPVTVHAPRNEQRPAAPLPAPHRAPARQMRAVWPWARTPMISAVYRSRPTLACPYKIGLTIFLLSVVAAMGRKPQFVAACAEEGGKGGEGGRGWNRSRCR